METVKDDPIVRDLLRELALAAARLHRRVTTLEGGPIPDEVLVDSLLRGIRGAQAKVDAQERAHRFASRALAKVDPSAGDEPGADFVFGVAGRDQLACVDALAGPLGLEGVPRSRSEVVHLALLTGLCALQRKHLKNGA